MTRRLRLLLGVPVAVVVLGVGAWLLLPRTAITRENAAKIQVGMTLAEVEAILGGPAREDFVGELQLDFDPDPKVNIMVAKAVEEKGGFGASFVGVHPQQYWRSNEVWVSAHFDNSRLTACAAYHMRSAESPLALLRRLLRL
jgi:hypothetical protein